MYFSIYIYSFACYCCKIYHVHLVESFRSLSSLYHKYILKREFCICHVYSCMNAKLSRLYRENNIQYSNNYSQHFEAFTFTKRETNITQCQKGRDFRCCNKEESIFEDHEVLFIYITTSMQSILTSHAFKKTLTIFKQEREAKTKWFWKDIAAKYIRSRILFNEDSQNMKKVTF